LEVEDLEAGSMGGELSAPPESKQFFFFKYFLWPATATLVEHAERRRTPPWYQAVIEFQQKALSPKKHYRYVKYLHNAPEDVFRNPKPSKV
jgi:hypothetical protein